jgi:hypothetical protein
VLIWHHGILVNSPFYTPVLNDKATLGNYPWVACTIKVKGDKMELNKIYHMDCLEGIRQLEDESVDLIITDPPYNIGKAEWDKIDGYVDWCKQCILECQRVLKHNGVFYWFHDKPDCTTYGNDAEGYGVSASLFLYLGQGGELACSVMEE